MARATSTVTINQQRIRQLTQAQIQALEMTAEALHTEVVQAQVIPFGETKKETYKEYGVRGQFAKNGREYKGKTKTRVIYQGGTLQNESTFVDYSNSSKGTCTLVSSTPYARRLYYHPEYNFNTSENKNAKGKWYEEWIDGNEKDFCQKTFKEFYKRLGGV